MKKASEILFVIILILLMIPAIQREKRFFKEKKLNGFFRLKEDPSHDRFTWDRWFSGFFQDEFSSRLEDHIGFRNTFFRINNQFDYSLFNITHAQGFISGKKGVLYEEDYIHEYTGKYFIGRNTLDKKFSKLKDVSDHLKAGNTDLIFVFEPGKASFSPENIPDHYNLEKKTNSNYDYYLERLNSLKIPYLDLNRYFLLMKDTCRYPLFPKYGMHWSVYGMTLAADTLKKYIENARQTKLPSFVISKIRVTDTLSDADNDIGSLLNLIFPLARVKAAYPEVRWEDKPPAKKNLSALVVGDSYYIVMLYGLPGRLFEPQEYWYYNSKLFPHIIDDHNPVYVDKSNLAEKLKEFDIILLMTSEINLHCTFWNFIDEAYQAFHPEYNETYVYKIGNDIRNAREWFQFMVDKARKNHVSLEEMINIDAEYKFSMDYNSLPGKNREDSIYAIAISIRNNPALLKEIAVKARARNISVKEMIDLDARYLYDQQKKH